jgi:nucleotide-binding universal stress UspA family protein
LGAIALTYGTGRLNRWGRHVLLFCMPERTNPIETLWDGLARESGQTRIMYTRILVAVDGSETSKLALGEALALAKVHRSQLRIVHVVDAAPFFVSDSYYANTGKLEAVLVEAGRKMLAEAQAASESAGIQAETRLIETAAMNARIADMIAQEATAWPADLIVVGTHGRRGLSHLFLGSVAEGVARAAAVPVLLIRAK